MKRILMGLAGVLALAAFGFFFVAPAYVDSNQNTLDPARSLPAPSPEAKAIAEKLDAADLHIDSMLWDRDFLHNERRGIVSLKKLEAGHFALATFSSVTKVPSGQNYQKNSAKAGDLITPLVIAGREPPATWTSLLARSHFHAEKLKGFIARSGGRLMLVKSRADLAELMRRRAKGEPVVGAMLSVEGLQNLEGKRENLDKLYDAGFRLAGLAHFFDDELAGSAHGMTKGGLTPFGREIVAAMEEKRMIVDVAHSSPKAIADVLAMAKAPVVSSHGGVKGVCQSPRNLSDDEIRGIARTGGLVAIGLWNEANCDPKLLKGFAKSVRYVRDLVGIEHVAFGSDWDGSIAAQAQPQEMASIVQALLDEGLTAGEINAAMGGNTLRLLGEALPG